MKNKIYLVCCEIDRNGTHGAGYIEMSTAYNLLPFIDKIKAITGELLTVTVCTTKKQAEQVTEHFRELIKNGGAINE